MYKAHRIHMHLDKPFEQNVNYSQIDTNPEQQRDSLEASYQLVNCLYQQFAL